VKSSGGEKEMGMPNIDSIKDALMNLEKTDGVNLLLISIAMEEIGLSHIINALGEKIQESQGSHIETTSKAVSRVLQDVIKKEMLLQFKLESVKEIIEEEHHS
jgi:hypothetical protein